jgi:hypothetical protein
MEGNDHGEAYTAIVWGGLLSRESSNIAEAEAFSVAEGNMCGTAMRGADALPRSKTLSRTKAEKLSEVLLKLNETSLSQLRRDHETGHLGHKIAGASK